MNKRDLLNRSVTAVLCFLALSGALGCLVTGMGLSAEPADLLLGCALLSLLCAFLLGSRFWMVPVCLGALLLGYWWQEGTLRLSFESLLYHISDLYDKGYGWGILQWTNRVLLPEDVTPALLALAVPVALSVSLTTLKGRLSGLGAAVSLLPLAACLLLKDTVPDARYVGVLLFAVLMLLLTGRVRSVDPHQANTLTLTLALPLTLALALLFTLCPREGYHMQSGAQQLEDWVLGLFDAAAPEGPALIPGDQARVVDLAGADQRDKNGKRIMTVRAQETATLYLRGCAYDIYDGTSWSATPGWNAWSLFYSTAGGEVKSLSIRTEQPHSVYYFSYVPYAAPAKVLGGRMRNDSGIRNYTVYYRDPVTYGQEWDMREDAIGGEDLAEYLQLPESTREGALQILTKKVGIPTETNNSGQIWKNALYIADWVSHRAKYDLRTDKMPEGSGDFALWFLNEAESGYCTHYATAATVLLRAAGIPAQYVTGYLVNAKSGQSVNVTEDNAHAWVEVFINGVGWVMLEPTPGSGVSQTVGGGEDPTISSRPTTPQGTEPLSTEDTATDPGGSTAPTQTVQTTATPSESEDTFSHPTATVENTAIGAVGGADPGKPANTAMEKPMQALLRALAAVALVLLQWRIRVAVNRALCRRGEPNRQALRIWKQLTLACRLARTAPDGEWLLLAQKARFSQHTLTQEELRALQAALHSTRRALKKRCFLLQPVYTLILAIY